MSEQSTRRDVLKAASAATLGSALSALAAADAAAPRLVPEPLGGTDSFEIERERATSVFPHSVASGGPTPSGVLLWTRLDREAYSEGTKLGVEVAADEAFDDTVYRGTVPAGRVGPKRDYTATVDLDGELSADSRYFYRFVYDGAASEVGRCRTLPKPDASPDSLSLAVASCNHYLQGYFGAFARVAEEDVDFLVHLGDFIYEEGGDGVGDRSLDLPTGHQKAHGLADFRYLYRQYRSDEFLRRALRNHTMIHTWDDHEIVGDRWWDYDANAPATEKHPRGDDPEFMRRLYVDGIRAYTEYVPVRARYEPSGEELAPDAIRENFELYRSFEFGDLADLFVTDERLYRSTPPGTEGKTVAVPVENAVENPGRTMLGGDQRSWFRSGMADSDARWKLWGNEVLAAAFRFFQDGQITVNADAWDGYRTERERILSGLADAGVENVVALTGDMHSYLAGYLLTSYELTAGGGGGSGDGSGERVGVEFMAPAVSSDNLVASGQLPDEGTDALVAALRAENPHVQWFDSSHWGYAVVDVTREELTYSAYAVDRSTDAADASKELLRRYRVPAGSVEMKRVDGEGGGGSDNDSNATGASDENDSSGGNESQ
ncbi:alkaline phosphatase D family protein (plasmid) [Halorussus limi]|uniref:Alkaline phosphatase D family protein n=1 Tax=Halorussus limi TaxID=2938695 RepID=A0A8U0HZV4_9EURY|nr:alkaline phosphatase D family protein [Halorussus limi]UPV76323.1 alkaline phosphatase D family protein [Halorussus limi]